MTEQETSHGCLEAEGGGPGLDVGAIIAGQRRRRLREAPHLVCEAPPLVVATNDRDLVAAQELETALDLGSICVAQAAAGTAGSDPAGASGNGTTRFSTGFTDFRYA